MNNLILVSAYGCEPNRGSESGVGWNWVLQLAKNNTLHVVTRSNNKQPIESCLLSDVAKNITFHYYDCPSWIRKMKKGDKGLYLYYTCWQIGAKKIFKQLAKQYKFDYAWHLSFGSWWMPTTLHTVGIPFIYGPLGGGDGVPKEFIRTLPLKDRIIQSFRYVLTGTARFNPLVMRPARKAVAILCRTENSMEFLPDSLKRKAKVILETAMDMDEFPITSVDKHNSIPQFITTGRLVPFKNLSCAIKALAIVKKKHDFKYTIIGKGPEKNKLEALIKTCGLEDNIVIHKQIPRKELLQQLVHADAYLFPSLREGGSWALMEAMAMELPPVCLNWTGMKHICDEKSAMLLEVTNPKQMILDFADAICQLIEDPEMMKSKGVAANKRMKEVFNWQSKGEFSEKLFGELKKNTRDNG